MTLWPRRYGSSRQFYLGVAAMTDFPALLSRIESGSGPDRELDALIHVALIKPDQYPDDLRYFRTPSPNMDHMEMCAPGTYWLKQRSGASLHTSPKYTASLDASIALCERVLPGWERRCGYEKSGLDGQWRGWAEIFKYPNNARGVAATEMRALLAAIVKARMAQDD